MPFERRGGSASLGRCAKFSLSVSAPANPDYLTVQAIDALNKVDVFVIPDKGCPRRPRCGNYAPGFPRDSSRKGSYRFVETAVPQRSGEYSPTTKPMSPNGTQNIEANYARLLREELGEDECAGFLVWATVDLRQHAADHRRSPPAKAATAFEYEVIPGISAIQALAARHRVPLNRIGESISSPPAASSPPGYPDDARQRGRHARRRADL